MKKPKRIALILTLIMIPVIGFGYNYFSDSKDKDISKNTLTVSGEVTTTEVAQAEGLVPGDKLCGNINIDVNSTAESLIRVKLEPYCKEGEEKDKSIPGIMEFNVSNESWTQGDDGYYYYNNSVDSDDNEILLCEDATFVIPDDVDANNYQDKTVGLDVTMEMLQAKHGAYSQKWTGCGETVGAMLEGLSQAATNGNTNTAANSGN